MPETDRDWFSQTIGAVKTVMDRYGFVEDELPKQRRGESVTNGKRREWINKLASALLTRKER